MPKKQKSGLYRSKVKVGLDANGKDVFKYISGKTKRELEANRQAVIDYYINGAPAVTDRLFGEYAVEWYKRCKAPTLSASSQASYRTALNKEILPTFGDRQLRAIQPIELQEFLYKFDGSSQTRITVIFATLRAIFTSACRDRILGSDPTAYLIKPNAKPAAEKRALTSSERTALEATCRTAPNGAYLAVLYYLGVRPGEARGLKWGDFDWRASTVHIQRDIDFKAGGTAGALKTAKSDRVIPVPDVLRAILSPLRGLPDVYLFRGERSGQPWSKNTSERVWAELMNAAGMVRRRDPSEASFRASDPRSEYTPTITAHMLRHNYITMCWENGIDPYTTMRLVGHANISTTMNIYTHLSNEQLEKTKGDVNAMFNGESCTKNKSCTKVAQAKNEE